MTLKKLLKTIKLNESSISFVLGLIVLFVVGSLIFRYLKANDTGKIPEELLSGTNSIEQINKIHTVAKNENLWNIAVSYYGDGFKWVDIATENKLDDASVIEEGQELVIPSLEENEEEMTNIQTSNSDSYTVVKGDSLWSIAVKVYGDGYQWTKIAKENNLSHPNIIHSGNILQIPK